MRQDQLPDSTRRKVLKSVGAALGIGAVGGAAAHPGLNNDKGATADEVDGERFGLDGGVQHRNATHVGYHSVGDVGPAGIAGQERQRHPGDANSEVRCHGDIAVTAFRASDSEDPGRRMAVLDISEFNDAETAGELQDAELSVLGILRNLSAESNGATDIKLSGDGNFAFLGTQALVPGGGNGKFNETDPRGNVEATGGVVAVDISDPARPRTVDRLVEPFSTGIHNLFHHRIDGDDYVFACKDAGLISPDSGLYIVRFDREPGKLSLVNRWSADGNATRGGVGAQHGLSYVHDVEVQDDPRTGRPTAYLADWDRGMRVLDVSDPTNIKHVGQFDMFQSHFAAPFPELIEDENGNTKRVAIASHEEPDERLDQRNGAVDSALYKVPHFNKTNPNSTGTVFLIDCDGIYPEDPMDEDACGCDHNEDGPKQLGELDNWTWKNVNTDDEVGHEDILMPTFSYQFSPHNSQPAVHEINGETRYIVHQGHYHGGVRYLEVQPGTENGLTEIDGGTPGPDGRRNRRPLAFVNSYEKAEEFGEENGESYTTGNEDGRIGWINNSTDWDLVDIGHSRPANDEIDALSPDFWSSAVHNGVSYHGDRGAGVQVTYFDGSDDASGAIPLENPLPPLEVERRDDGSAFLAGQTNRVEIEVDTFERPNGDAASVTVRDRIPDGYEVIGGDAVTTYSQGNRTAVEFQTEVQPGDTVTLTYFVEVPSDPGSGTFGPVEVSPDGREWDTVGGTTDSNLDAGFNV